MFILLSIISLCLLILFHEFGHFLAAKLFHVEVREFSLGMGPKLISKVFGETLYSVRLFPVGGYVSMTGEDGDTENPRSILNLVWWKRVVIMAAGVVMNFLIGIILVSAIFLPFKSFSEPVVAMIPEEVSQHYQLYEGDRILQIDRFHIYLPNDVDSAVLLDRDGIMEITKQSADGEISSVTVETASDISMQDIQFCFQEYNLGEKIGYIKNILCSMVQSVRESLVLLFSGKVHVEEMSGPVGIVNTMRQSPDALSFLYITAFISVNLAVMNLIPIPALDGGQIMICILERLFRRSINKTVLNYINVAAMVLLMGLMAIVSVSDIVKLF